MAISITRARAKESNTNEKAKRGPPSSSESTPRTRSPTRIFIESTKAATRSSLKDHKATTSQTQISSYYVKPKTSSLSGSQSQSLRQLKNDYISQKPSLNRRSSHEMPTSASISSKPKANRDLSSSRPHKTFVSLVPRYRVQPLLRTSSNPTPSPSPPKPTISAKPISKIPSSTPRAAKPKPALFKKGTNPKKSVPATKKKVVYAPVSSKDTPESSDAGEETSRLETVPPVTEQGSGALKVEDDEHQDVEKVSKIPPHVETTQQHHEQHDKVEPDQPQIQVDGEREIHSALEGELVSVTEVEEAKGEPKEEKTKGESTSQGESNDWRHPEEQPATDGDVLVKEKEKEGGVTKAEKSGNNSDEKTLQKNDGEEARTREDKTEGEELVPMTELEEVKIKSTPPKEEAGKESQENANVIKETAIKLMETKKNKVRALAGAFQSAIDHQTSS